MLVAALSGRAAAQRHKLPPRIECTVTRVIDGDTLYCRQDSMKVRLIGIDAPSVKVSRLTPHFLRTPRFLFAAGFRCAVA
jgi:endonuclease YncB( thermonuclease family)